MIKHLAYIVGPDAALMSWEKWLDAYVLNFDSKQIMRCGYKKIKANLQIRLKLDED
jgi:hypothetical protein